MACRQRSPWTGLDRTHRVTEGSSSLSRARREWDYARSSTLAGPALAFTDRGIHQLKGGPEEWQILAVDCQHSGAGTTKGSVAGGLVRGARQYAAGNIGSLLFLQRSGCVSRCN